jgi:uncharacterized integral membrane protein
MVGAIGLLLALLLALGFAYFGAMNMDPVSVQIWPGVKRSAFIIEIAAYAAIAGVLFSTFFLIGGWLGAQSRCRQLRRRVRELERQLLQAQPVVSEAPLAALENGIEAPPASSPNVKSAVRSGLRAGVRGERVEAGRRHASSDEEPV